MPLRPTIRPLSRTPLLLAMLLVAPVAMLLGPAGADARSRVYKVPAGGTLIVPSTSITDGARVIVRRGRGPRVQSGMLALGRPVSLQMRGGRLVGPVRLILPVRGRIRTSGMPIRSTVVLAFYNARTRRWETVRARFDRKRRTITARITHFSWWNPLSWDWDSIVLRADQRLGELRGARTGPAPCDPRSRPVPKWAETITNNGADLQLRTCAEGEGDRVVVQIVNNRPFGMMLRYGAPVAWGWHETSGDAIDVAFNGAADALAAPDELYLPPLKRASVGVPRGNWFFAPFQASTTPATMAVDLFAFIANKVEIKLVRPAFFGRLASECSAQIKVTVPTGVTFKRDLVGWIATVSGCVARAIPKLEADGLLNRFTSEQLAQTATLLSRAGTLLEAGKIAANLADLWIAQGEDMQGNMSFSIGRKAESLPPDPAPAPAPVPVPVPGSLPPGVGSSAEGAPRPAASPAPRVRVNAYDNYGQPAVGRAMCRGNPGRPESMPGGTATQRFTVPTRVASIDTALVQIDADSRVTAHATLAVNGAQRASAVAEAAGDTRLTFGDVAVRPGDQVALSISFTASFGKIITVYTTGSSGDTFTASNSCPDGAPSFSTAPDGLRAVLTGWSA